MSQGNQSVRVQPLPGVEDSSVVHQLGLAGNNQIRKIRLNNIKSCLTPALTLLKEMNDAFGPPFGQAIANTIETLINIVQNVKKNKEECAQLMENIHPVLLKTIGSMSPVMLNNIGKFMETLHRIYTFLEVQQNGNKIKHLFHRNEMQKLLKDCYAGLDQAVEVFEITTRPAMFSEIDAIRETAQLMHEELLELVQTLSDASMDSDRPKIFHGRESEVENILKMLSQESSRIAILGGGGMGKTSLARAVLHHPDTLDKFQYRFFVSAESATTSIELAALIGLHVGLNPGGDLTRPVVQYLSQKPSCLLILDNLETVWEPIQARGGIEEFLSLLTEVKHLALLITMRGAERPAKVHWTHPFLLPLQPLSAEAAQKTFLEITDNVYGKEDIEKILQYTDNMPLAVDLIAHLSDYEGLENVLARWDTEKTALLSVGQDRKSNLDASIELSLSSPRMTSNSKELLSLLSILPDGLSDAELVQSNFPIPNILGCKTALLATSLTYRDGNRRLRSLMPIREHVQKFLPPSLPLVQCLRKLFYGILELYQKHHGEQLGTVINQITLNLANLQEVLQQGLYSNAPDLKDTIHTILFLNSFHRITGQGYTVLLEGARLILHGLDDPQLEIHFISEVCMAYNHYPTLNREQLITRAISLFGHVNNPLLECIYFLHAKCDPPQAMQFYQKALRLSKLCQDSTQQCAVLISIAMHQWQSGDYRTAQVQAAEAQRLSQFSANLYHEARALWVEALCSILLGNFQQGMEEIQRGRVILGICGLVGGDLDHVIRQALAEIHLRKSEYAQARSIYSHIVQTTFPEQNAGSYAITLLNIAHIDTMCGDTGNVYHKLNQAKDIFNNYISLRQSLYLSMYEADVELREEKYDSAQVKFQECLRLICGKDNQAESFCLERLANITAWPILEWPSRWPVTYLGYSYKTKDKLAFHKALICLGDMFVVNRDGKTAQNLFTLALEGFTHMDVHCSRAQCMIRLGDLANKKGHSSKAITLWNTARPLFEQSLQSKHVAQIDARLLSINKA
ncbi:hypothetical protein B0H14DRAFT_3545938 [Mycena olivaceomarginata]|nr:hypothetical protein B0H14DRAFT_3545938 [Mycena olivaceomarginata]